MTHKALVAVLFFLNLLMGTMLIMESTACKMDSSCPANTSFQPVTLYTVQDSYVLIPIDNVYLPRHIQNFAHFNRLGCFTDGVHDVLAPVQQAISFTDLYQASALFAASQDGNLSLVKMLMDTGISPNQMDCFGNTPLSLALENQHPRLVSYLLQNGADERFAVWLW